jgi:hypothetical protein
VLLQILVLGWCVSQRDMEVVRKVVQQVCVAHAPEGGTTVSAELNNRLCLACLSMHSWLPACLPVLVLK